MLRKTEVLVCNVILVCTVSLTALAQKSKPPKPRDSLHELSKKAGGHFVFRYKPNRSSVYPNIEELAKRSDLIVVGRTVGHRTSLRPDGNFITNDYTVRVQDVIKGDLPKRASILVTLPGGTFRFPDGTFATVMPIGEKTVEDRQQYIFFLKAKKAKGVFNGYLLISETQGVFGLTNAGVEPGDTVSGHPLATKYRGMPARDFLAQIHQAVPRKKK